MEAFSMRGHLLIAPTPVWRRPAPGVGGLPRVPDLIRRPPNCSVENRLNCSVVVFKVLHNSRLRWRRSGELGLIRTELHVRALAF